MITTILNPLRQTRHLNSSTRAYDTGELDALLDETAIDQRRDVHGTQLLSSEMLAQILAGDFASTRSDGVRDGRNKDFTD